MPEFFHSCQTGYDSGIYVSRLQGFLDVVRLHLYHPDIKLRIFLHQLRKETRQQIGGYGGKYAQFENSAERMLFFFYNVFYTMGLNQHIPGLFYDVKADGSRAHRLLAAVENLCVQLFFQLLNHGAQGGLCDPAIFSGFGEMTELIDSKYVFQLL